MAQGAMVEGKRSAESLDMTFKSCPVPTDLLAKNQFDRVDYQDCFRGDFTSKFVPQVDALAKAFFSDAMPRWIRTLLGIRNRLVAKFGLNSDGWRPLEQSDQRPIAIGEKVGMWRVVDRNATEIVFRENDKHLDFTFSLRVIPREAGFTVEATTLVEFHGLPGKLYFLPVKPFHKRIVPAHMDAVLATVKFDPTP
jgi:hypothetical protein